MEERDSPSRLVCGGFNKQGDLRLDLGTAEWIDLHSACQNLKAYREVLMRFSRIRQLPSHVGFATHCSLKAVFLKPAPMGGVVGRMYSPGERTGRSFQLPLFSSQVLLSMTSSSDYEIRVIFHLSVSVCSVAQLCQTICDPMDCSVHGISQARNSHSLLRWGGIKPGSPALACRFFTTTPPRKSKWNISRSIVLDSVTPWTLARQVPLSIWFPRQGSWSG